MSEQATRPVQVVAHLTEREAELIEDMLGNFVTHEEALTDEEREALAVLEDAVFMSHGLDHVGAHQDVVGGERCEVVEAGGISMSDDNKVPLPIGQMTDNEITYHYELFVETLSRKEFVRLATEEGWAFWVERGEGEEPA